MKTEKAKALNVFLNDAVSLFINILENYKINDAEISVTKDDLNEDKFKQMYEAFEVELRENILEYNDIDIVFDYINTCLNEFNEWEGFGGESNSYIINKGNEVKLLLKTKQIIDKYKRDIRLLLEEPYGYNSYILRHIFEITTHPQVPDEEKEQTKEPTPDDKFIFDKMLIELTGQNNTTLESIGFINDRLYEFKKWQLANDTQYKYDFLGKIEETTHHFSKKHYPYFEKLCGLEIEMLQNKNKIEKAALTQKAIENNPIVIENAARQYFIWKSTDTDLLELLAALYQNQSIARKDGKTLTRKELTDYFQQLFGMEIKDVEGKLNKATNRKINMTPFLDSLNVAFKRYAEEKFEKQSKR